MAAKAGGTGTQSLNDALMDAAQALTRAMGTPEAANPQVAQALSKLQMVTLQLARHPGGAPQPPGGGAAPGAAPGAGTPAGVGPPGGGAANPAMASMAGPGAGPPPAPGGPGATGMPQMNPEELRRLIGANT